MAHVITTPSVAASASPDNSSSLKFPGVRARRPDSQLISDVRTVDRRNVTFGLTGAVVGLAMSISAQNANAGARRPPPPPKEEKKDPNVSGVQAKVLASKKRKEAMKENMAKLREKGKPINVPSKSPSESEQQ